MDKEIRFKNKKYTINVSDEESYKKEILYDKNESKIILSKTKDQKIIEVYRFKKLIEKRIYNESNRYNMPDYKILYDKDGDIEESFSLNSIENNYKKWYGNINGYKRLVSTAFFNVISHNNDIFKQIYYNYDAKGRIQYINEEYGSWNIITTKFIYKDDNNYKVQRTVIPNNLNKNNVTPIYSFDDYKNRKLKDSIINEYNDRGVQNYNVFTVRRNNRKYQIHQDDNGKVYGIYKVKRSTPKNLLGLKDIDNKNDSVYLKSVNDITTYPYHNLYIPYQNNNYSGGRIVYNKSDSLKIAIPAVSPIEYTFGDYKLYYSRNLLYSVLYYNHPIVNYDYKFLNYSQPNEIYKYRFMSTPLNDQFIFKLNFEFNSELDLLLDVIEEFDKELYDTIK